MYPVSTGFSQVPSYHQIVDDEQFQQIAKSVADPSRLSAMRLIAGRGEASCSDLSTHLKLTPATISHHVKELTACGLVELRREAKYNYLTLNRRVWQEYLKELKQRLP
ncbi:MAG TPA: helix-turn-helix transcriptional regulator [Bryobacteraceae bacterium]|jgi:ArsR family transcriptional regulator|nr:helix-turn-helix transcriptional regulator [Bryobacteraceae bacterium]